MKTILVTGAAMGIGEAVVDLFSSKGYKVIGLDRVAPETPKATEFYKVDLADRKQLEDFITEFTPNHNKLDVLVNNAAVGLVKPAIEVTFEEFDHLQAVNARAPYFLSTKLFPLLAQTKGSIVNISSVHALATMKNFSAYALSKGGLTALTRSLALEFGDAKVRVNAVLPGLVTSHRLREHLNEVEGCGNDEGKIAEALKEKGKSRLLGRVGEPGDIANAVWFFAENNDYTTGQTLVVDGGNMALYGSV